MVGDFSSGPCFFLFLAVFLLWVKFMDFLIRCGLWSEARGLHKQSFDILKNRDNLHNSLTGPPHPPKKKGKNAEKLHKMEVPGVILQFV